MADQLILSPIFRDLVDPDLLKPSVLDKVFVEGGKDVVDGIDVLFHKESLDKATRTTKLMAGIGRSTEWQDGKEMDPDSFEEVWKVVSGYKWYGKEITMEKSAVMDLKSGGYGIIDQILSTMGFMATVSQQELAARFIDANATQTQLDGKCLFDTGHPLSPKTGGDTYDNYIQSAVNFTSLRDGRNLLRSMPDHMGVVGRYNLDYYACHPNMLEEVSEYVKSSMRPDTEKNAKSFTIPDAPIKTWPFLENENAVYLVSNRHSLYFLTRQPLKRNMFMDDKTWSITHQAAYGCAPTAEHWSGIVAIFP